MYNHMLPAIQLLFTSEKITDHTVVLGQYQTREDTDHVVVRLVQATEWSDRVFMGPL